MSKRINYVDLYQALREEWRNWNSKVHQDDKMDWIDYVDTIDVFNGVRVSLNRDHWGEYQVVFN